MSAGDLEAKTVDRSTADHYTWGTAPGGSVCDGWHLVRGAELSVIEERMPPGAEEQRHFHQRARQFFYVVAGELTMEAGGGLHKLLAGQGLEIAPGLLHQARNASNEDVRFLVISQPPTHGDRVASDNL